MPQLTTDGIYVVMVCSKCASSRHKDRWDRLWRAFHRSRVQTNASWEAQNNTTRQPYARLSSGGWEAPPPAQLVAPPPHAPLCAERRWLGGPTGRSSHALASPPPPLCAEREVVGGPHRPLSSCPPPHTHPCALSARWLGGPTARSAHASAYWHLSVLGYMGFLFVKCPELMAGAQARKTGEERKAWVEVMIEVPECSGAE